MIVIPMAGNSSRFYNAGYHVPKYELPIRGRTLFALCVESFKAYFRSEHFVFVCRPDMGAETFVAAECARLGVLHFQCVTLAGPTRGQAETVLLGIRGAGAGANESVLIFNIDTVRPGYVFPSACEHADGYLEVFSGEGDHWSFVRPAAAFTNRVAETTEKKRISSLCCTGLYHFARACDFAALCEAAIGDIDNFCTRWGELYVAPMYNTLIESGRTVSYHEVAPNEVLFSGTPDEYEQLKAGFPVTDCSSST